MRYIITSYKANMNYDEERDSWVTGVDVPDDAFVTVEDFTPGYSKDDPDSGTISVNIIIPVTEVVDGEASEEAA